LNEKKGGKQPQSICFITLLICILWFDWNHIHIETNINLFIEIQLIA
jgi:hypothetical protein